jgi:hypothetical protein
MNDWDFENTSLVILGAGFSRAATDNGTPLMKGYFDRLGREKYPELFNFVLECGCDQSCRSIGDANVEEVLLTLEQIRTSDRRVVAGWFDEWKDKVPNLRRQLGEYTIYRLVDSVEFDSDNWAVNILASTGFGTTFISLNYDTIAETILSKRVGTTHCGGGNCPHCRMRQLLQATCNCSSRSDSVENLWKGTILKPHGSIAWSRCVNPQCCMAECIDARCDCLPARDKSCGYCREPHDLAIVFPTMGKNLSEIPEISTMWQAARFAISEATSILLFGFSLPTSDALFGQLIQQGCKHKKVKRIGVIDLCPDDVIARLRRLVSTSCHIDFVGLPVPREGEPDWYVAKSNVLAIG